MLFGHSLYPSVQYSTSHAKQSLLGSGVHCVKLQFDGKQDAHRMLTNINFYFRCECGKCVVMDTAAECKCCGNTNVMDIKLNSSRYSWSRFSMHK